MHSTSSFSTYAHRKCLKTPNWQWFKIILFLFSAMYNSLQPPPHPSKYYLKINKLFVVISMGLYRSSLDLLFIMYLPSLSFYLLLLLSSTSTVPFRIVRHGLWPVTTAPKFYFGRGQCDAWFWPNFGELKFRPGILKLEFSANALSQPAKDNVTRDTHQFRRRQRGLWPVTRRTIRNGTVVVIVSMPWCEPWLEKSRVTHHTYPSHVRHYALTADEVTVRVSVWEV